MTSNLASRRARATTLAPRSCPSSPWFGDGGCVAWGSWARRRSSMIEALLTCARHVKGRSVYRSMIRTARPDDVPRRPRSLIFALPRPRRKSLEHEVVGTEVRLLREHFFGAHLRAGGGPRGGRGEHRGVSRLFFCMGSSIVPCASRASTWRTSSSRLSTAGRATAARSSPRCQAGGGACARALRAGGARDRNEPGQGVATGPWGQRRLVDWRIFRVTGEALGQLAGA